MTVAGEPFSRKPPPIKADPRPDELLAWYDIYRRNLPWRALPGETPDPYRVYLSEIMLQQTTVKTVAPYYARFLARWPTVTALAAADLDDVLHAWAGLGYYARARNLHACAKAVVERYDGRFPDRISDLLNLPGVGPYTAAALAAIAFERPALPVDGNVERVVARFFALDAALPRGKPVIAQAAQTLLPDARFGDFAQALMDLGATICTPKKPTCGLCPWNRSCAAWAQGAPEAFPKRAAKTVAAVRRGAAFVVLHVEGGVLLRRRPAEGLLGGMAEVPTTAWTSDFDDADALSFAPRVGRKALRWRKLPGTVRHVFTHFPLHLVVYRTELSGRVRLPRDHRFVPVDRIEGEALPNLMRKVLVHAGIGQEKP